MSIRYNNMKQYLYPTKLTSKRPYQKMFLFRLCKDLLEWFILLHFWGFMVVLTLQPPHCFIFLLLSCCQMWIVAFARLSVTVCDSRVKKPSFSFPCCVFKWLLPSKSVPGKQILMVLQHFEFFRHVHISVQTCFFLLPLSKLTWLFFVVLWIFFGHEI